MRGSVNGWRGLEVAFYISTLGSRVQELRGDLCEITCMHLSLGGLSVCLYSFCYKGTWKTHTPHPTSVSQGVVVWRGKVITAVLATAPLNAQDQDA